MSKFKCSVPGCKEPVKWLVWYKGCMNLYYYLCNAHTFKHMKNTDTPYPVVCVRSIDDAIPEGKKSIYD